MKTIAVLTDFSARAEHAAIYALHLAKKIGANIILYNICPLTVQISVAVSSVYSEDDEAGCENNDNLLVLTDRLTSKLKETSFPGAMLPDIMFDRSGGIEIVDVMTSLINDDDIILIVISPNLNNSIEAFIQGCDCQEIVNWANVPVLVVPESASIRNPEKIAFVSEFDGSDTSYISSLVNLTEKFSPEIMIAHLEDGCNSTSLQIIEKALLAGLYNKVDYGRIYCRCIPRAKQSCWQWLKDNKRSDMLVIVQQSQHKFKDFFKHGQTSQVTHHITIPVLIFPA
jgi:nucleotide-binding universal stress UspA family protein